MRRGIGQLCFSSFVVFLPIQIYIRADNGGGPYEAKFTFPLASGSNRKRTRYPLCDGRWHQLRAEKQEVTLHISVDNMTATVVTSTSSRDSADTNDPLYIGGIPGMLQVVYIQLICLVNINEQ